MLLLSLWIAIAPAQAVLARCAVTADPQARVYELQRSGDGDAKRWIVAMRSRQAGAAPVALPLPGATPVVTATELTLEYRTQNGGRDVRWKVTPAGATLDVRANFELEVNIEPDLDPRVELMNTEGPITRLTCELNPAR